MAARSIASLSLSFGLVSVPVKLYSATESSAAIRFNLLSKTGSRLKQQYVAEDTREVVERADMVKGYEFEKDRFVIFTPDELKALDEASRHTIDIVSFVPLSSVDPIYYDKAYYLAPDKRGGKPYTLLLAAMKASGRCALARWAWKGKQYVVQVRPGEEGLVLQQLLYDEEVRSQGDLHIEQVAVSEPELQLALQLIDQISADSFDPASFKDEEKQRMLAAIDEKIAGKQIIAATTADEAPVSAQVIDLMDALRASLKGKAPGAAKSAPAERAAKAGTGTTGKAAAVATDADAAAPADAAAKARKSVKRAPKAEPVVEPARSRSAK